MANYKHTINLPKTDYPQRAGLKKLEPRLLEQWEEQDIYHRIRKEREGEARYVLHDGPPYASGQLHIGTGMNKILKDIVVKYKTMRGFDAPYIPGWDCHGLPIERKVLDELGDAAKTTPKAEIRQRCQDFALGHIEGHRQQFKALGVFGRWQDPYLTLNPRYEAGVMEVFRGLVAGGYMTRQRKPIHWCMKCTTALAEAELEYHPHESPSITVRFDLVDSVADVFEGAGDDVSLCIWTTTPWTLVANQAIAVHPDHQYALLDTDKGQLIVAEELVERFVERCGLEQHRVVATAAGSELEGRRYRHAFVDRTSPVVLADYVEIDQTGMVHTAPGHGQEDFLTGKKYELEVSSPVNAEGHYTSEAGDELAGMNIFAANKKVCEMLEQSGHLLNLSRVEHSYPHCWRCKQPVIFRATSQWFVQVDHDDMRQRALQAIRDEVDWIPEWGQTRIEGMVADRPDWCVSRQRAWGIPIPALYCEDCGEVLMDEASVARVRDHFAEKGANSWFLESPAELLGDEAKCRSCGSTNLRKEEDIFDVWFESGSSWKAVCDVEPELEVPADLYLEGTDQHRGWFQLSLLPAIGTIGHAPFRTVLTHGFVVDETGHKMSKSLGNYLSLADGLEQFGGDILRLWFSSVDYTNDVGVSRKLIKRMSDTYRKIRNTIRFLLGNLQNFDPTEHDREGEYELLDIDRWALAELQKLIGEVTEAYDEFRFQKVYRLIHNFCTVQLSSVYLDIVRDRLYTWLPWDKRRRAAQLVCHRAASALIRLLAPILVYSAEEAWGYLDPEKLGLPDSVHLAPWPEIDEKFEDPEVLSHFEDIFDLRDDVLKALEAKRKSREIGNALEARVRLYSEDEGLRSFLDELGEDELATLLIVSEVVFEDSPFEEALRGENHPELQIKVSSLKGVYEKCARSWRYHPSVGTHEEHPELCTHSYEVVKTLEQQGET